MARVRNIGGLLALFSLVALTSASGTCYKLSGDAAYKDFIPCNQFSGATSYCCGANRQNTNATYTNDVCMTNGLCQAVAEIDGVEEYRYFRESCSSTSWPLDSCLRNVCTMPDQNDVNGNAIMTPCEDTMYSQTWCCGKNNTACCGTDSAITLPAIMGATATLTTSSKPSSTSSASSTISTPSTSDLPATTSTSPSPSNFVITASSTPSSTPSSSPSSTGLSTGAQAGIGVAVALLVLSILAGAFYYLRRRRATPKHLPTDTNTSLMTVQSPQSYHDGKEMYLTPHELDSRAVGHELDPAAGVGEVEGDVVFKRS
ncbi:hypothetical protein E4T47_02562 [Aureobasidium subglaciale]|nr:hypothetical protein E4T43_02174 [Aureobasidium subglaciale]KAI5274436.1 hypothetical protein E4T47_02562 [Aureobasidium subglaciale]